MADLAEKLCCGIVKYVLAHIGKELEYLIDYGGNIDALEQKMGALKDRFQRMTEDVNQALRNGDEIYDDVKSWIEKVNLLVEQVTQFLRDEVAENRDEVAENRDEVAENRDEVAENRDRLHGWCANIKKFWSLSKKAKKKTEEAAKLQNQNFERIAHPPPPPTVGDRYIGDYKEFDSRTPRLNEMMDLLRDDASHIICLCGIGGAGKTTMAHEIAYRAKKEGLFDEIVEAVASQNHDEMKTQEEIARYLGLNFKETTLNARADELWKRLLQSKKGNLVIIDDVWESFNLKEIGIPCGGEHNNCKVVLTSRKEDVYRLIKCQCKKTMEGAEWENSGCHKFVGLVGLNQKESWSLFTAEAGNSCYEKPNLYQTASEIVEKCDGLPIALVTLGKALNGKTGDEWVETLEKMKNSTFPEDIGEVYLSLKASYDLLENKEAKILFLLCCLYPEDRIIYEDDLVCYTLGLDYFKDINGSLLKARRRVRVLTAVLKRCNLLLDGGGRTLSVKVHDVLRVVGNTIASSEEAKADFPLSPAMAVHGEEWKNRAVVESCKALSVVSDKIVDFGSSRMDLRELEVLQFSCENLAPEAVSSMFEGMGEIKVVIMWGMRIPPFSLSPLLLKKIRVLVLDSKDFPGGFITIKDLDNLVILRLSGYFEGYDLGNLTNLRLLDVSRCLRPIKFSTGFISQLQKLEELRAESTDWGPGGGRLESVAELESLTCLSFLGIKVNDIKDLSGTPFLGKLKRYVICVGATDYRFSDSFSERKISLYIGDEGCTDLGGGVDRLIEESVENLYLKGDGMGVALKKIGSGRHRCLKELVVRGCRSEMVKNLIAADYSCGTNNTGIEAFFPQLEILRIEEVKYLERIVGDNNNNSGQVGLIPTGSFAKLREIHLVCLPALLSHLFTLSVAKNLGLLETLSIQLCHEMVEIISNNQVGPSSSTVVVSGNRRLVFPKLNKLALSFLEKLECFCQGGIIEVVEFPQLQTLLLDDLPKLVSFCPEEETSLDATQSNSNIDARLQPLFNSKVVFSCLEKLKLISLHRVAQLWSSCQFPKLKVLEIDNLSELVNVFPSDSHIRFPCLERLDVRMCESMEIVFGCKEQTYENIKYIQVRRCPKLQKLCSGFTFKGFTNLETLKIEDCGMENIVGKEGEGEDGISMDAQEVVTLNKLETVELKQLKSLKKCFCNAGYALRFPELTVVLIRDCPNLSTFSPSLIDTPKLKSVSLDQVNTRKVDDGLDLNKTIEHDFQDRQMKMSRKRSARKKKNSDVSEPLKNPPLPHPPVFVGSDIRESETPPPRHAALPVSLRDLNESDEHE